MAKVLLRKTRRIRRKLRIRGKIFGNHDQPRLSIFRSNKYIYGQIIDDLDGKTLASISLNEIKQAHEKVSKSEAASKIGEMLAKKAKDAKVKRVVVDRNGYRYHGRVKSFADGLRKGGIEL